jgi:hypothetical protein
MAYTTINKPSQYFNTVLYTGTGATLSVTGVGFQSDFRWLKQRSYIGYHQFNDTIRGITKYLSSNASDADYTDSDGFTAIGSDGFTVGTNAGFNTSGETLVAWNWLGGGTGVSNTAGTISSTVSANTTSGFSIVSYSGNGTGGATVGHGLGSALGLIILKCRSTAGTSWQMFHKSLGATKSINLEDTAAAATSTAYWNDTAPTSSVFTLGTGGDFNNGSRTYISYCFAEVKGYSKFGSYTGNGSANGNFVYIGFKPAFVVVKNSSLAGENWVMLDNKRDPINPTNLALFPNLSNAEGGTYPFDFLSNGFKIRDSSASYNRSGDVFIYMAFAENPFVTSGGIPTTAR